MASEVGVNLEAFQTISRRLEAKSTNANEKVCQCREEELHKRRKVTRGQPNVSVSKRKSVRLSVSHSGRFVFLFFF